MKITAESNPIAYGYLLGISKYDYNKLSLIQTDDGCVRLKAKLDIFTCIFLDLPEEYVGTYITEVLDVDQFDGFPTRYPTSFKLKPQFNTVVQDHYYTIAEVLANPDKLYIFGDNVQGIGKKGQAIIRDCPNALGIPTKNYLGYKPDNYFDDELYNDNASFILTHIHLIMQSYKQNNYKAIVFPKDGIGTGLADLKNKAPKTWKYLCNQLLDKFNFNNDEL
jgi:hypothetical protein